MNKLFVLMITAFVDMVGVLIIIPVLPFYAKSLGAGATTVGVLVSAFAVAQLLSAPMWGRFSDRYGRRPALLVGLTASALAYIIFGYANSIWLLFLSRLVQGAGGGTVSVIQAYVADALPPEERAKGLGWISAATNAGVALGPMVGSVVMPFGSAAPGWAAAGLCIINIVFAWRFLNESRDMTQARSPDFKRARSRDKLLQVVVNSGDPASRLIWIYAIGMGAFQGMNAMLALFLAARFGVTKATIGFFFTYVGVISVLTRALVLGRAVDHFGEARLSRYGQVLLATGMAALPFTHRISGPWPYLPLAIAVALIPLGTAFTFPCVTSLLSRVIPSTERGVYMGVQQTYGGLARVLFPIAAGFLFDRVIELPFLVSAALVAGTIFLGVGMDEYTRAKPEAKAVVSG